MPNIYGGGYDNYSTEEQVIGTQIDGKPIYQKTIKNAITLDGSSLHIDIAHNINNIDFVVNCKAFCDNGNTVPSAYANGFYYIASANKTVLSFDRMNAAGWDGAKVTFTIQYTKTTD